MEKRVKYKIGCQTLRTDLTPNLLRRLPLLILLVFLLFWWACASRSKAKTSPDLDQIIAGPRQSLLTGDYQKAITEYDLAFRKYPTVDAVLVAYVEALEGIKGEADRRYAAANYASAETLYGLLLDNFSLFEDFRLSLSFSREKLSESVKSCRLHTARFQADLNLRSRNFGGAMASIRALLEVYPTDPECLAELVRVGLQVRQRASLALTEKDYSSAGQALSSLSRNMDLFEKISPPPLSRPAIEKEIDTCRMELTRKGLEHYRKGNLTEAIAIWKDLLAFDPDNLEIRKAVETATEQLKKIKKEELL